MTEVTGALAEFAADWSAEEIPPAARHAARRTIANTVGLMVGAACHPACEIAAAELVALGSPPQASLLGRPERLGVTAAPLVGGIAAHVEDFDDTHLRTVIHPGAPIVPAALAVAEWVGASGAATVDAVTLGVEVTLRVGNGLGPGHFDRGWHLTSTTGRFGAAAAVGRLLGLDAEAMRVAFGVAATEAAGLQEALGTMTKSFHPGKAAADGVEAALLARAGLTAPVAPIEGRRGLARVAAPAPAIDEMVAGLGTRWEITDNAFKPYACGIVSHPVIDAAIAVRDRVRSAEDVASVEARVNPVVLDVMGVAEPVDGLQSKFSVYHCFAVGLIDGVAGPAQFSDDRARDPRVVALRRRVHPVTDASIRRDETVVTVVLEDGTELVHHVEHATASVDRPMTDEELRRKCLLVASPVLGDDAAAFVDLAFRLDELPSVGVLVEAGRPAVPHAQYL